MSAAKKTLASVRRPADARPTHAAARPIFHIDRSVKNWSDRPCAVFEERESRRVLPELRAVDEQRRHANEDRRGDPSNLRERMDSAIFRPNRRSRYRRSSGTTNSPSQPNNL